MDPHGFQKELGDILVVLLHGPVEALAAAWNQKAVEALDSIIAMHTLLAQQSPRFMEELRVLKRDKRQIEHCWRKSKNEADWIWITATIKAYLMAVRVAKNHYFSSLTAFSECCQRLCSKSLLEK